MTHPAVYAITLGVALGAALFAYFASAQFRQENPHTSYNRDNDYRYKRSDSEQWGGSRTKSGRETCSICLESIDKWHGDKLPCGHEFHRKCIAELKSNGSNQCPNCRRQFK